MSEPGHLTIRLASGHYLAVQEYFSREGAADNCRVFPKTEFRVPGSPADVIEITRYQLSTSIPTVGIPCCSAQTLLSPN